MASILFGACGARAAVWQYAAPAKAADGREIVAYLWVPPQADRLRGVLVGGMATSMEPMMCEEPVIREACARQKLAIVYFAPHLDALFGRDKPGAQEAFATAMNGLAAASGYRELAVAPLFPFGHSVSTVYASLLAAWQPQRCFGVLLHKGGIVIPSPEVEAALRGAPILAIKGQFEEYGPGPSGVLRDFEDRTAAYKAMRDTLLNLRAKDDRYLLSLLVEPGATHFAWASYAAPYVAMFISKSAEARIPDWPIDAREPVKCIELDPARGALSDGRVDDPKGHAAAAYGQFKGAPRSALWHLDAELARAADGWHARMHRKPQFVTFADAAGKPLLPPADFRLKFAPRWTGPGEFKVSGTFLDAPLRKYPPVEGPVGHAEGPVRISLYGGQVEQTAPDTFRVKLDPRRRPEANLMAWHPGDPTYRYAELAAILPMRPLTAGKPQAITFPPAGPLKVGGPPVKLAARSDSGLPVSYYVESGPAVVEGEVLRVAEVPARAAFPMSITVVAWQYGSATEPQYQSAERVKQVIELRR